MSENTLPAPDLWSKVVSRIKDTVVNRSLWEALENTRALVIENDVLIIGMNTRVSHMAGHITSSDSRNAIDRALQYLSGRPIRMRLIDGDTLADWAAAKASDAKVAQLRQESHQKRDRRESAAQDWDAIYEQAARTYSGYNLRTLPQNRAAYLNEMIAVLADAAHQLYPANPDEQQQRMLARVIDRIATNADVSSTVVALELNHARTRR